MAMAQEANPTEADFVLGREPVTAARALETEGSDGLPVEPLMWAVARNPQQILVCWSVNWRDAFAEGKPPEHKVYLRLSRQARERLIEVEPARGYIILGDLEPGAAYSVELGYFNSANKWQHVGNSSEVSTPSEPEFLERKIEVEVAFIPLHLEFQKVVEQMKGRPSAELASFLAHGQGQPAGSSAELLKTLGFYQTDMENAARVRVSLEAAAPPTKTRSGGGSGSPVRPWSGGS